MTNNLANSTLYLGIPNKWGESAHVHFTGCSNYYLNKRKQDYVCHVSFRHISWDTVVLTKAFVE